MEKKNLKEQIDALEKLAKDPKSQQEIGKRLIQEVAKAMYEERKGLEISNPDAEIPIRKGDMVPLELRDQIKTDEGGLALQDALVQNLNLRIWFRIWVRFWFRIIIDIPRFETSPLNSFREFTEAIGFSDEERQLVDRLKGMS